MLTKTCTACQKQFTVTEQYSYILKCFACFKGTASAVAPSAPTVVKTESIALQSVLRSVCLVRGKNVKIERLIKETLLVYSELFGGVK